ncbi:MAG: ExeM/NucH family extracellular endonuclease, partial [Planctomycetota bacterium]
MIYQNKFWFLGFAIVLLTFVLQSSCSQPGGPKTAESKSGLDDSQNDDSSDLVDPPGSIQGELDTVDWNSMLGQEVTLGGDLVVVDTFDLIRRGQIRVARNRLMIPTSEFDPNDADAEGVKYEGGENVAKISEAQKINDSASIILDDGLDQENLFPPRLFPGLGDAHPTVRIGSTIQGVSGKLVKSGNKIVLVPNGRLQWNPVDRPKRPDLGNPDIVVASFNVLNYFTTIDNKKNGARGADSLSEFSRQEAKLVSAITQMKADVIGLMELENNLESEQRLVKALNEGLGKEVFQGCGLPTGFRAAAGGDNAIRVGIIFRNDRVSPVGEIAMIRDDAFDVARTPLVQKFKAKSSGPNIPPFTLIVNHFKSKGGSSRANKVNKNKGDGQGAYNSKRVAQSLAICSYIESVSLDNENPRVLMIGDLNAYEQEDPIDAIRAKGLVDLRKRFESKSPTDPQTDYSFVYYGQSGSLDHAFATQSLADQITRIATWHINADEPRFLDYNEEYNPESVYQPNPFRSSDHDPVLIG